MSAQRADICGLVLLAAAGLLAAAAHRPAPGDGAAGLADAAGWAALPADRVAMRLQAVRGPAGGPALRLEYDFQGRAGWAAARRSLPLALPPHYEIRFQLRGNGPRNHLEVKLVDATDDNVWWHVRRDLEWPADWTPLRVRQRQVSFAWGPAGGGEPQRIGALELTVTAGEGGRGWIEVAELEIVATEPPAPAAGPLRATASASTAGFPASAAVDGDASTAWRPPAGAPAELVVDLGGRRELGGVSLSWAAGAAPRSFAVELSEDGRSWSGGREVRHGGAPRSHLPIADGEGRFLRLRLPADHGAPLTPALSELVLRPLAFGASTNGMLTTLAQEEPRGSWPRGFSEAVYWTVVGAPGDHQEALVSEDGAVELGERDLSLEPFVQLAGRLYSWADAAIEPSLAEGDLPLPTVTWRLGTAATGGEGSAAAPRPAPAAVARLEVTPLAAGEAERAALLVRYRLVNESATRLQGRLVVAVRPLQVNPPYQFLNAVGGVAPIGAIACGPPLVVDGAPRLWAAPQPGGCGALAFDQGPLYEPLARGALPAAAQVEDPLRLASAALSWELAAGPGERLEVVLGAALSGDGGPALRALQRRGASAFAEAEAETRRAWRERLGGVLVLPPAAAPLAAVLRSNLAWVQIHRDGPALQPGSRAYARSWIRDGALTGAALLRTGHSAAARDFAEWFARFQYPDGKVPCCVDRRGADPVPEHDSHGELIHLIAEVFRYTGDQRFLERLFPHVARAVDAIEALRQQRRGDAYRAPGKRAFFGLLPESISHEGYSAKPVHSYWDDTFAYRGLDDAVMLARALGRDQLVAAWTPRRDELRDDLLASIEHVRRTAGGAAGPLPWLPASADLADFDSTATTTLLDPGGLQGHLPAAAVEATFERYWRELVDRRDGRRAWESYTPYEIRHVGAFVRLALARRRAGRDDDDPDWVARAHQALDWFLQHRRPLAWNGWPEAVHREARAPRFLGDLPHGWVGTDYVRSLLDLLAFERREDESLVLGAGVPAAWLEEPGGVGVRSLATPWGPLTYTLQPIPGGHRFRVAAGTRVPPGGFLLVAPGPAARAAPRRALLDGRPAALAAGDLLTVRRPPPFTVDILAASEEER